jgi:general secretion pathway protein A
MFLDFYKLREQPFSDTPDPRCVYLSQTHREALASLFYGIETGRGFLALIAEPGMGKTTLLFHLLEHLRSSVRTAFLFQTQCDSRELLRYLLADLGIDARGKDLPWMHEQLKRVLIAEANAGKRLVVFIDEAQNLDEPVLETVRLLSDFETPRSKLMQIVLAGQPELADKLARPTLAQLRQRISIVSRLSRFTRSETDAYINHRLRVAGYKGGPLFSPEVRAMIAAWSGGVPRNINNLCFNVLTLGYALGRKEIDCSLVQEAANDLELTPLVSKQHDSQKPPGPVAAVSPGAPLHADGTSGEKHSDSYVPLPSSIPTVLGLRLEHASRAMILAGAVVVFLLAVGAAGALFLHRGTARPPATAQTNPLPVAPPVSTAANTAQGVPPASKRTPVVSRPASQELAAGEPALTGRIPEGDVLALLATALRPSAMIGRDAPPNLTAVAPNAPADANAGILPASSGILPALPPPPEQTVPLLVGGQVRGPQLVSQILPDYPLAAKHIGLEGKVVVNAVIDATGKVTHMNVVSGPELLQHAALDAVRQSKYEPRYLDGKPVTGEMFINVQFRLH